MIEDRALNRYANALAIETGSAREGVALLDRSPYHTESAPLKSSVHASEMSQREEVIVISGTITISP